MSGEELPAYGRIGALEHQPDGSGVQCHLCGLSFIHLGIHARHGHGMPAHEYREAFGLNRGTALTSSTHSDLLRRRAVAKDAARRL